MELPARYPPYGAFENNKDVVYCRYGFPELYRERQPTQKYYYDCFLTFLHRFFYPTNSRTTWTNSILLNRRVMIANTHEMRVVKSHYTRVEYDTFFVSTYLYFQCQN
jgi:hypothetical protein